MIPYDDLEVALATWRARQGLPGAQLASAAPTPPPRAPAPPPAARMAAPSGPPRAAAPPPAQLSPELQDFDVSEGALIEDGHDEGGDDYVVPFGDVAIDQSGETTAIGGEPEPPTEHLLVPARGKRNPAW
jgi:hypothetical protein